MSYELSFSPEFFTGDGYTDLDEMEKSDRPTSVYQALISMPTQQWLAMCEDVFPDCEAVMVDTYMVMEKIRETNSCSNLSSPVRVWVDPEGYHTVSVYDSKK